MNEFGRSSFSDCTGDGEDSELESQGSERVISFEANETASENENPQAHLQKKDKDKIKERIDDYELRCLNEDILAALKRYKEERVNIKKKKLSARRRKDLKKISVLVRSHKKLMPKEKYIQALKKAVSEIKGGTLFINRNKSTLKDVLNEILRAYTQPTSFEKKQLYIEMCHYTKIQRSLKALGQGQVASLGLMNLEEVSHSVNNNNNQSVQEKSPPNPAELEVLRARVKELGDDNANLRSRLKISRSGGGSGDSKQSKPGKSPPSGHSVNSEESTEDPASGNGSQKTKRK